MDDLISRQAAIDAIKRYESADSYDINRGLIMAMNAVADVPTIDPVKHGKWVIIDNSGLAVCECGYITDRYSVYNYCPNCGARME